MSLAGGRVSISRRTDLDAHRMSIGGQMNVNRHARKAGDWQQLEWLGAFQTLLSSLS